jgi:hypothetical protein
LEWGEEPLCLKTLCRKKCRLALEISVLLVCKPLHILQLKLAGRRHRSRVRVGVIAWMNDLRTPCAWARYKAYEGHEMWEEGVWECRVVMMVVVDLTCNQTLNGLFGLDGNPCGNRV